MVDKEEVSSVDNKLNLEFSNVDKNIPISFDITVTFAYYLQKLGVNSATNIPKEFDYPVDLKEDYLKIEKFKGKIFRENNKKNIDLDSKEQEKLDKMILEYAKDFENAISKQKGNFSYKLYN